MKFLILLILFINSLLSSTLIGNVDKINIPNLNLENIDAKIDTGAKTSSLHCEKIKVLDDKHLEIEINHKKFKVNIFRISNIKSSNAISQKRYIIKQDILIFNKIYNIEFSLANRKGMEYPVLLGREFLEKGFIVDVTKKNLSYNLK